MAWRWIPLLALALLIGCGRDIPIDIWISDADFDEAEEASLFAAMDSWERVTGLDIFTYRGRVAWGEFSWEDFGDDIHGIYKVRPDSYEVRYVHETTGAGFGGYGTYGDVLLNLDAEDVWRNEMADELFGCYGVWHTREECHLLNLQDLATHELGHFIGLSHIPGRRAIMNPELYGLLYPTEVDLEAFWNAYSFRYHRPRPGE